MPTMIRLKLADLLSLYLIVILGFHFIVVKDAVENFTPITYNALRFALGAVVMALLWWWGKRQGKLAMSGPDLRFLFFASMLGLVGYQIMFVVALSLTTSTNTALMVATMPTWTAVISLAIGQIIPRRGLFLGLALVLSGVSVVVIGTSEKGLAFSGQDALGSLIGLIAAFTLGAFVVSTKHIIDRYGGYSNAIYRHLFTTFGLLVVATPDMLTLSIESIPLDIVPNILYSAFLASLSGFFVANYAIQKLGAAGFANYNNFIPLVTAMAGIIVLGEALTLPLILGGGLTLVGVALVRHYTVEQQMSKTPDAVQFQAKALKSSS